MDFELIISELNFSNLLWQIITPLIFCLADIITGYIQAIINNEVDSTKMRIGLLHKSLIVVVILLSNVCRFAFNLPFISSVVSIYVVLMEIVSIMENLTKAGLDFGKLGSILKVKKGE